MDFNIKILLNKIQKIVKKAFGAKINELDLHVSLYDIMQIRLKTER